jgi:hypothetical protein
MRRCRNFELFALSHSSVPDEADYSMWLKQQPVIPVRQ